MNVTENLQPETQEIFKKYQQLEQKIAHYNELTSVAGFDLQTIAPKKGRAQRSEAIGALSGEIFRLSTSKDMADYLAELTKPEVLEQLDETTRKSILERHRSFERTKKIPADKYQEFVVLTSKAHDVWAEARQNNDFKLFAPVLKEIVQTIREFAEIYGYEGHPYNALLENYEQGLTVDVLDPLFKELREATIDLLNRIQASKHKPDVSVLNQKYDVEKQKAFCLHILPKLGYDLDAGLLSVSAHPFASGLNTNDVRITTRYDEDDMRGAIFGTIHECGHALYEQGVDSTLPPNLRHGTAMSTHESQSRFLENVVGRSIEFWNYFFEDFKSYFPTQLEGVDIKEFGRAINNVEPSLIRVEADELTYNLHIMIRYEIEKGLISGEIEVDDLPQIWNAKMEEYLGITPPSDALGVLQDVHWSFGGFGYFPSYSLGNLYAAQFLYTLLEQMPSFYEEIEQGNFAKITSWLKENIHQHGAKYTPAELSVRVTGEELNAKYLIRYLNEKYTRVYKLEQ